MALRHPYEEYESAALKRRWAEEVLYLHSLWRHGPNPNPYSTYCDDLGEISRRVRGRIAGGYVSEKEWPCDSPQPREEAGFAPWPDTPPATPLLAIARPPDEVIARANAIGVQMKGVRAAEAFFAGNVDSDGDVREDEVDLDGSAAFEFFSGILENDSELRSHYQLNWKMEGFICLACVGLTKQKGRKFPNCVALIQHAVTVNKTSRMAAHRALARALCAALGWDINRLPSVHVDEEDAAGQPAEKPEEQRGRDAVDHGKSVDCADTSELQNGHDTVDQEKSTDCAGSSELQNANQAEHADACLEKKDIDASAPPPSNMGSAGDADDGSSPNRLSDFLQEGNQAEHADACLEKQDIGAPAPPPSECSED